LVAEAVLVGDRALAHVGDDLHVGVRMRREAGAGLDGVVVPHPQRAPVHPLRVVVAGEGEVVPGVEPAVVGAAEAGEGAMLDHAVLLRKRTTGHDLGPAGAIRNRACVTVPFDCWHDRAETAPRRAGAAQARWAWPDSGFGPQADVTGDARRGR